MILFMVLLVSANLVSKEMTKIAQALIGCEAKIDTTCKSNPLLAKAYVSQCISDCLQLSDNYENKPCHYDEKYGHALGINCPREFDQPIKSSKVLMCNFLMGIPESLEMNLIFMCDIIIFSQFFHYDSVSTYTFKLREKNYQTFLRLREAATKYGVKLIVQVGSYDEDVMSLQALSLEISTPERQAELVEKLMNIADTYNLDGYVIYYVSPGCPWRRCSSTKYARDRIRFEPFVRNLGEKLKAKDKTLALYALTTDTKINLFSGDYLSNVLDVVDYFIMEMSYQQFYLNQLSAELKNKSVLHKLIISYTPQTLNFKFSSSSSKNKHKLGAVHVLHGDGPYTTNKVCRALRDKKFTKVLDVNTQNYAFSDSFLVPYDDKNSMQEKIKKLLVERNLAGIAVETYFDDLFGECDCGLMPYTRMIADLLKRPHCSFNSCF